MTNYVSLKTDVNVPTVRIKQKELGYFLKATAKKIRNPVYGSKGPDPGSVSKCHGSKTGQVTYLSRLMSMYLQYEKREKNLDKN
jgi:hypothetical protein